MKINLEGYTRNTIGKLNSIRNKTSFLLEENLDSSDTEEISNDIEIIKDVIEGYKDVIVALARGDSDIKELVEFFCLEDIQSAKTYKYSNKLVVIK